jgi:ABC-type hemin transport system ATPase subunit
LLPTLKLLRRLRGNTFQCFARLVQLPEISERRGDMLGILGPNGSGKTTLLKILGGALTPRSGSVTLHERPVASWPRRELARRIAFVPQETYAPFDFHVVDIVLMGRFPHLGTFELEGPDDLAIARRALEATGTVEFESRQFNTLSGGEKQRVVIAAALPLTSTSSRKKSPAFIPVTSRDSTRRSMSMGLIAIRPSPRSKRLTSLSVRSEPLRNGRVEEKPSSALSRTMDFIEQTRN